MMDTTNDNQERGLEQALVARVSKQELARWTRESALRFRELMSFCRCAARDLEARLWAVGEELLLQRGEDPVESVEVELISPEAIVDRVLAGGYPLTAESIETHIPDLAAVKAVCAFPADVYRVAEALARQGDIQVLDRRDDLAAEAGQGYRGVSLAVSVPARLMGKRRQIRLRAALRTPAMELWCAAERRFREPEDDYIRQQAGEELRECARLIAEWDQRMERLRHNVRHGVITK